MAFKFADLKKGYTDLWTSMVIREDKKAEIAKEVARMKPNEAMYQEVSKLSGVPAAMIAILHNLEAHNDPNAHLHNGDPLSDRTKKVPKGRPLSGNPPFSFKDSALDALKLQGLDAIKDWSIERMAFEFERYNGMGYRKPGRGNSPYLWSYTNQYTKGKFESDGSYNPELISKQPGTMTLLRQLMDGGTKIETAPPAPPLASNVVPLESGLFIPIGPFKVLPTATAKSDDVPDTEIVEEDELVKKLGETGLIWEIEVQLKGGGTKHGFARGGIFKPQPIDPVVDLEGFALECLNAARLNKTSAQHLIALADLETGIRNVAAKGADGAGPFLIGADVWTAATAGGALAPAARFDPLKQPFVAAKIAADATKILQSAELPTSAELYVAHLIGATQAQAVLADRTKAMEAAVLAATDQATVDRLRAVRPWLFDGGATVKDVLEKIARAMDFGYERADALLKRVEPDLEIASAPVAGGFAARLVDKATQEWKFFGEQARNAVGKLTKAGHKEDEARVPAGSGEDWFARVGVYWREGTGRMLDGRNKSEPWSAAFISYCVKVANPSGRFQFSARHSVFISKAIRDLADKADAAGYWCHRLPDHKPKVGDIVCWAREAGVDYDHQKGGDYAGHTDIIVEVRANEIDVIGGNVGDSVTKRTLVLEGGFVKGGMIQDENLFAIMENRIP